MVTGAVVLLLGGLKLIFGPRVFTVFELHEMDVSLFWRELFLRELTRVTDLGSRWSGCGWRKSSLFLPRLPLFIDGHWELAPFSLEELICLGATRASICQENHMGIYF
eukprot:1140200-Pelagomonas_calceolata.AAC.3